MPERSLKQRRSARAEPAQGAHFYRQVVETLPHMAWTARPDGSTDYFNARVIEFTGRTHKQLEGWGWRSMVHPDDWERCLVRWTKAFQTGVPYEVEYRLRRRDGKYLWHLGAAMPLREGDRILRWVGSCTEIENQKRAERLLEKARQSLESLLGARADQRGADEVRQHELVEAAMRRERASQQERFRQFMDSVPAIAWIKDSEFRYVWLSASYERILGRTLEEMRGRDDSAVWPSDMAEGFRRNDEKVLRVNGAVQDVAITPLPGGGTLRWLAVKFPLPDESGAFGVAGMGFDITGREGESLDESQDASPLARLSGREVQVMQMIVDGLTSAEAGARLGLSPKSIDTYRSRLMAKLGITDLPALVKFAIRHGLTGSR